MHHKRRDEQVSERPLLKLKIAIYALTSEWVPIAKTRVEKKWDQNQSPNESLCLKRRSSESISTELYR